MYTYIRQIYVKREEMENKEKLLIHICTLEYPGRELFPLKGQENVKNKCDIS